jgi:type I restriction enzyme M protein
MNMFLHGMDSARIEWCDTINSPRLIEDNGLMKFDIVVANPPFSLDKWGAENASNDRFNRFHRGIPPKGRGDYAFITHMLETALENTGKVAVIVPHGVLFRGGSEGKIRRQLIESNFVEAVVGLPPNLFYGTGIPTALLVFNKAKTTTDILFVDGSRSFASETNQNRLRPDDISSIVDAFNAFEDIHTVAKRVSRAAVLDDNDGNLNIPRYVETHEDAPEVDVKALVADIRRIEDKLQSAQAKLKVELRSIGYDW